jgi:hypothetical protein
MLMYPNYKTQPQCQACYRTKPTPPRQPQRPSTSPPSVSGTAAAFVACFPCRVACVSIAESLPCPPRVTSRARGRVKWRCSTESVGVSLQWRSLVCFVEGVGQAILGALLRVPLRRQRQRPSTCWQLEASAAGLSGLRGWIQSTVFSCGGRCLFNVPFEPARWVHLGEWDSGQRDTLHPWRTLSRPAPLDHPSCNQRASSRRWCERHVFTFSRFHVANVGPFFQPLHPRHIPACSKFGEVGRETGARTAYTTDHRRRQPCNPCEL